MTRLIDNIIPYPLDCEVRLGSVMASLLMSLRRDVPDGMAICTTEHRKKGKVGEPCFRCGGRGRAAAEKLYFSLANEYAFVSGQALLPDALITGRRPISA